MLAATAAMLAFNAAIQEGVPAQAEIVNAIKTSKTAADAFRTAFERGGTENFFFGDYADGLKDLPGLLDKATNATANWIDLSFNELGAADSIKRYGDGLAELAQSDLPAAQEAFAGLRDEYNLTDAQTRQLLDTMPAYRDVLLGLAGDQEIAGDSAEFLKLALGELPDETEGAESGIDAVAEAAAQAESDLTDMESALSAVGETALGMGDAVDRAQSALNDLAEAAKVEGSAIDGTNDASISLRDSMRDVEQSHRDAAVAIIENGGTLEEATTKYNQGRDAVIEMMVAKGMDRDAAIAWADTNFGKAGEVQGALAGVKSAVDAIPEKKPIEVTAETAAAISKIETFIQRYNGRTVRINVVQGTGPSGGTIVGNPSMGYKAPDSANGNLFQYAQAFANGGFATGIYAGRPESIHKFAEPETIWEAYISGKPDQRTRNIGIWEETGRRLGVDSAPATASFPDTVTLVDADGSILAHARVIADQTVAAHDAAAEREIARGGMNR
jgi:hypothetical protein